AAGVLQFQSASNADQLNPTRQNYDQYLLVVNTNEIDVRNPVSNYGTRMDIAGPGTNILSLVLDDQYGTFSGTSMATPNVAAVATLIWVLHPTWTREQVAAQLIGTVD